MNFNSAASISRWAEVSPQKIAIYFDGLQISYGDLNSLVSATALLLMDSGVVRGDRVSILGMNSAEYVIACLAVSRIGAVSVFLNYRLSLGELKYLIEDSDPVVLLIDSEFDAIASELEKLVTNLKLSCALHSTTADFKSVSVLRKKYLGSIVENAEMDQNDLERILYTSGTTSKPKGVMLSHGNSWWNLVTQILEGCNSHDERTLVFAPLYHIGAQELPGLRVFGVGGQMVIMRQFDARSVLEAVSHHQITGMVMVSTMIHIMRDLPDRHNYDTSSLRWLVFGQVPENMLKQIRTIFPNAALKNSYGLTESCSTVTSIDPAYQERYPTSPGRAVPTVKIKIVDDTDNEVLTGELGEIIVNGPKTMLGYWRQPEATAEVLRGGWLRTGDVGFVDNNKLLYVVDRKKDMIRTGGENVASQEVERVIYEIDWVAEVAVIGVPDEKWGEQIKAVVVARNGFVPSTDELLRHCKSKLATFKIPKQVEFRSVLPRNPSGKILKRELK